MNLEIEPHDRLLVGSFVSEVPAGGGESPDWVRALLEPASPAAPMQSNDEVRAAVRDVLRLHGYKPTGRGKPASEYLLRGVSPINLIVDIANAVSLHSGLPISVVDLEKTVGALRIGVAPEGTSYVFNLGGQEIDVAGLPCLFDANGACANAVRDAQRTKTDGSTKRTLSIVWGAKALGTRTDETVAWYQSLLARATGR